MYRVGMSPDRAFRPGLKLMTYLDGNLSSNGLDDPALDVKIFHLPWWTGQTMPTSKSSYLCSTTLKSALDQYRLRLEEALIPFGAPHTISNLANELNKPAYTWHSSVDDHLPNNSTIAPNADSIVRSQLEFWTNFATHITWSMPVRLPTRQKKT